jgi:hypothetical protein
MKKGILFCSFYLVIISILGCEDSEGPEGHSGQMKYSVFGEVEFISDALPTNASIYVSNISSIPTVKLNQDSITFMYLGVQSSSYWDTLRTITEGDEVQLTIIGNQGEAGATVRIPRQFRIQSPDPDSIFILLPHSNFSASWTSSGFSNYYYAYFYLNYSYVPTGGGYKYFSFDIDTILSTTSISIPAAKLFPPDFDSLTSNWSNGGAFNVEAVNGPKPEVGAEGNVTGDGIGFFFGRSDGGYIEIRARNSTTTDSGPKLRDNFRNKQSEKFYKKFLKWQKMNY